MSKGHLQNVDFEFIRYANCWEDPYVLLDGFDIQSDSQIVSIASGGDNSFSLAAEKPERVIALDVSIVQLFLVQLKIAAIRKFNRSEYLEFAGFNPSDAREEYYKMIRDSLDKSVRAYWDLHLNEIKTGIIHIGKFEKYFQLFRDSFLLKIHDQSTIDGLFEKKSSQEQLNYYDQSWFDPRWEEMHGEFFSKEMLGEKGRDPEFLKEVNESVSASILRKEVAHVQSINCQSNPFLFYILNNRFDEDHLPHYVRMENYERVKANVDRVVCEEGLIQKVLPKYGASTHFNLSNIFEYMTQEQLREVGMQIVQHAKDGAQIAYWNFMVHRSLTTVLGDKVTYDRKKSEQLSALDNGYFYNRFELDRVHNE